MRHLANSVDILAYRWLWSGHIDIDGHDATDRTVKHSLAAPTVRLKHRHRTDRGESAATRSRDRFIATGIQQLYTGAHFRNIQPMVSEKMKFTAKPPLKETIVNRLSLLVERVENKSTLRRTVFCVTSTRQRRRVFLLEGTRKADLQRHLVNGDAIDLRSALRIKISISYLDGGFWLALEYTLRTHPSEAWTEDGHGVVYNRQSVKVHRLTYLYRDFHS